MLHPWPGTWAWLRALGTALLTDATYRPVRNALPQTSACGCATVPLQLPRSHPAVCSPARCLRTMGCAGGTPAWHSGISTGSQHGATLCTAPHVVGGQLHTAPVVTEVFFLYLVTAAATHSPGSPCCRSVTHLYLLCCSLLCVSSSTFLICQGPQNSPAHPCLLLPSSSERGCEHRPHMIFASNTPLAA